MIVRCNCGNQFLFPKAINLKRAIIVNASEYCKLDTFQCSVCGQEYILELSLREKGDYENQTENKVKRC